MFIKLGYGYDALLNPYYRSMFVTRYRLRSVVMDKMWCRRRFDAFVLKTCSRDGCIECLGTKLVSVGIRCLNAVKVISFL